MTSLARSTVTVVPNLSDTANNPAMARLKSRLEDAKPLGLVRCDSSELLVVYDSQCSFQSSSVCLDSLFKVLAAISQNMVNPVVGVNMLNGKRKQLRSPIAALIFSSFRRSSSKSGILPLVVLCRS